MNIENLTKEDKRQQIREEENGTKSFLKTGNNLTML